MTDSLFSSLILLLNLLYISNDIASSLYIYMGDCMYFVFVYSMVYMRISVHDIIPWGPPTKLPHCCWTLGDRLQGDQHFKTRTIRILLTIWVCTHVYTWVKETEKVWKKVSCETQSIYKLLLPLWVTIWIAVTLLVTVFLLVCVRLC